MKNKIFPPRLEEVRWGSLKLFHSTPFSPSGGGQVGVHKIIVFNPFLPLWGRSGGGL